MPAKSKKSPGLRRRVYEIMRNAKPGDTASGWFDYIIAALIIVNALIVVIETVPEFALKYGQLFILLDSAIAIVFTIEYALRLWSCTATKKYSHPLWGRLRFALAPMSLVDLVAIIPFYAPIFLVSLNLNALRALRLLRLARILKIYRYSDELQAFGRVIKLKRRQLTASLMVLAIGLIFSSTIIYFAESQAQPEHFGSIPASLWWSSITLSTVGYGDVIPVTPIGRLFGAIVALLGIGIFAIPAGILASGYMRVSMEIARHKNSNSKPKRRR